ncbi:rifampicin phosphotransferase-like [Tachypleus tridentatus]|uniref:rifampicin phosphotransferase-like n=1 Tax=Tachypleus tridentatus TaxID=6853 RepID=UPI003FD4EF2B
MWPALAVIIVFCFYHLLRTKALPPTHGVYNLAGRSFWLKKTVALFYLKIRRWIIKRRFDLYDFNILTDLVKCGCMPPEEEIALEAPQSSNHLVGHSDEIFFYGVKSTGESLVVKISRLRNKMAEVMVLLKTTDDRRYSYPDGQTQIIFTGDNDNFCGGGLKLKCLSAMRKWRISFNGLLRETYQSNDKSKVVHVKFSFIWLAMSNIYNLTDDISIDEVAEALAKEPWSGYLPDINSLEKALDVYEQAGQLLGNVTVEGLEEEFTLWGMKRRYLGSSVEFHRSVDFFGFINNGSMFHICASSLQGIVSNLVYGHYLHSNAILFPIRSCNFKLPLIAENGQIPHFVRFTFKAGQKEYYCAVKMKIHWCDFDNGKNEQHIKYCNIILNDHEGTGLSMFVYRTKNPRKFPIINPLNIFNGQEAPKMNPLVVDFECPSCQQTKLTGGKGSSLAKLTAISCQTKSFIVPKGVVVTTSAYKEFIKHGKLCEAITKLEEVAWCHVTGNLNRICEQIVSDVSTTQIPGEISEMIKEKLLSIFGRNLNKLRFAVRSSATGEDSDELSAAGQNETFLGVKGINHILDSVSKCWASQFSFTAIEYKRQYGQLLNSPMAVIIQEMVPADVSGVMFTCDPVTNNPSVITITANYGLGETVVSAAAEPDTIFLDRDYTNKIAFRSINIGKKNICYLVEADNEIKETVPNKDTSQPCLSECTALALGEVGILVEQCFSSPRDIEWALFSEDTYLLQARPVTYSDTETEFELIHDMDTPLQSENECLCKGNVGEVMPGATSPLGLSVLSYSFETAWKTILSNLGCPNQVLPCYYVKCFTRKYNHMFFNISDNPFFSEENAMADGCQLAILGRLLRDNELKQRTKERHSINEIPLSFKLRYLISIGKDLLNAKHFLSKVQKENADKELPSNHNEAEVMYKSICQHLIGVTNKPIACHNSCTVNSMMWNSLLLRLLVSVEKEWNDKVFTDFGYLLSTCTNVESANVPVALKKLALIISDEIEKEEFLSMSPETALRWLSINQSTAGQAFRNFLRRHGHRCVKEFDVNSIPWGVDPKPLVKNIQSLIVKISHNVTEKKEISVEKALSKLQVSLRWWQKWVLRFLLPWVRNGVRLRETSKSVLIKMYNVIRHAYTHLATLMVKEGRLPDPRLLFFLTHEEIGQLLQTRSARLVAKAVRRRRVYPQLDALCFSEITQGIPKPVKQTSRKEHNSSSTFIKGTPINKGIARGPARVVTSSENASEIQAGDILVTYSTDIGWSPYFPLLSGVATELGGLISHGAIVAREYGLPCIVGLHGATSFFKSGEIVQLDGSSGKLEKITD